MLFHLLGCAMPRISKDYGFLHGDAKRLLTLIQIVLKAQSSSVNATTCQCTLLVLVKRNEPNLPDTLNNRIGRDYTRFILIRDSALIPSNATSNFWVLFCQIIRGSLALSYLNLQSQYTLAVQSI